jgi:hypothetical protein
MFLTHEIGFSTAQFSVAEPEAARGRAHTGTRFLNGITQVGFLPGLTISFVLRVSSNGFKALPSEG